MSATRSVAKNTILLSVGLFSGRVLALFLRKKMTPILGPDGLGILVTALSINTILLTDQLSTAWAQKYAAIVLPCHVASHGLGPSYTAIASAVRLLAVAFAERAGPRAGERMELIAEIHEELDDTE